MDKYALVFDEYACWGCLTCEVACKQEYNPIDVADGVKYLSVWPDGPKLVNGKLDFIWRVAVCKHCEDPACLPVCPTGALTKRPDGIVILNEEDCTGCQACIPACPYNAIDFDEKGAKAIKCNLCYHRVDQGLYPACADNVCLAHCIYFGDPAEIEKVIAEKRRAANLA
ncbi:MAG: 4Fe-4S binding protein [Chloroflexi bacterium]|nr:4Fe-4S binding protein [Chloroflexota bacterium]